MIDIRKIARSLYAKASHNVGLKLFSLLLGVLFWGFVISSDPNIPRDRQMNGLTVNVLNRSVLEGRYLAVVEDLTQLAPVNVRIEVPQSDYNRVNTNTVRVDLDLSRIDHKGTQRVPLTVTSIYGKVTQATPGEVELTVEEFDKRTIPVSAEVNNPSGSNIWVGNTTVNPPIVTLSGPRSQVQRVKYASAVLDLSSSIGGRPHTVDLLLTDENHESVVEPTISYSPVSVVLAADVYPMVKLPINSDPKRLLAGSPMTGFQVDGVDITPSEVTVAASQQFLDTLTELAAGTLNISGLDKTATLRTRISRTSEMRFLSSEEIDVTVRISEMTRERTFNNLVIAVTNTPAGKTLTWKRVRASVTVRGPYTKVSEVEREDLRVYMDLTGFESGDHAVPLQVSLPGHPDVECVIDPATVAVTLQ